MFHCIHWYCRVLGSIQGAHGFVSEELSVEIPQKVPRSCLRGISRGIFTECSTVLILWNFPWNFHRKFTVLILWNFPWSFHGKFHGLVSVELSVEIPQ